MEGSEGDDWATANAGGSEEVVDEVLAMRAVLFAADSAVGMMRITATVLLIQRYA